MKDDLMNDRLALEGFKYDTSDPVALRLVCLRCGEGAGIAGQDDDYAHGWLDHWAHGHFTYEDCAPPNNQESV
jgi:hypothetical protein